MQLFILSRSNHLYSTQRLFKAARQHGHQCEILDYSRINTIIGSADTTFYYQEEQLARADMVIGRISPIYTPLGAALLSQFTEAGAYCAPISAALLLARNKWRALGALKQAGLAVPRSAMLSDRAQFSDIVEQLGGFPIIIKLLESTHGAGVILAPDARSALSTLDALASLHKGVLLQEYIAESGGADVRAIVCAGEVVAAMTRTPAAGEFRSNLHRGGIAQAITLSQNESQCAIRAAEAVGLDVAGVDFLRSNRGPLIMEVNASPGLEGIEAATQMDVAGHIIAHTTTLAIANRQ